MLLPEQIISSLEEDVRKYFKQEKSIFQVIFLKPAFLRPSTIDNTFRL